MNDKQKKALQVMTSSARITQELFNLTLPELLEVNQSVTKQMEEDLKNPCTCEHCQKERKEQQSLSA